MTEDRLLELIEVWGADLSAFPEGERGAAKALVASQPGRFASAIAEARGLDAALALVPEVTPSAALTGALIDAAPKPRVTTGGVRLSRLAPWAPASGFAALAAGLFMGLMVAPAASATNDTADVESVLEHALGYDPAAFTEEFGE